MTSLRLQSRASLLEQIRARGIRLTTQRTMLANILDEQDRFLDAPALLAMAQRKGAHVDRATVYRTLALLRAHELLAPAHPAAPSLQRANGPATVSGDELNLTCDRCGGRQPVTANAPDSIKREIRRCTGFQARAVRLEASGECRLCAAKMRLRNRKSISPQTHTKENS